MPFPRHTTGMWGWRIPAVEDVPGAPSRRLRSRSAPQGEKKHDGAENMWRNV